MLMKLRPREQNLFANIVKLKWPLDVTLEVKVCKVLIFNDIHNLKTRIYRESNDQAISWDKEVVSTWNFQKLTDDVIFIPGVSFNFILCVAVEITCVHRTSSLPAQKKLRQVY